MLHDVKVPVIKGKALEILTWAGVAIAVIVVVIVISKLFKAFKSGAETAGDIAGAKIIQAQTGITLDRQAVCRTAAQDCENSITRVPFIGSKIWVSDDGIINALNRLVTAKEAAFTSEVFRQISSDSLKGVVEGGYMTDNSRNKINQVIRQNLN